MNLLERTYLKNVKKNCEKLETNESEGIQVYIDKMGDFIVLDDEDIIIVTPLSQNNDYSILSNEARRRFFSRDDKISMFLTFDDDVFRDRDFVLDCANVIRSILAYGAKNYDKGLSRYDIERGRYVKKAFATPIDYKNYAIEVLKIVAQKISDEKKKIFNRDLVIEQSQSEIEKSPKEINKDVDDVINSIERFMLY